MPRLVPCLLFAVGCFTPPDLDTIPWEAPILTSEDDAPYAVCAPERDALVGCVIDGDTLDINGCRDDAERIRLLGIDTPETAKPGVEAECFADVALAELSRVASGRTVRLSFDRDCTDVTSSGRTLAYVWLDQARARVVLDDDVVDDILRIQGDDEDDLEAPVMVNLYLLLRGYARHYDTTTCEGCLIPRLDQDFVSAERLAQVRGEGLWSACR